MQIQKKIKTESCLAEQHDQQLGCKAAWRISMINSWDVKLLGGTA
jgi:hypothetical protein